MINFKIVPATTGYDQNCSVIVEVTAVDEKLPSVSFIKNWFKDQVDYTYCDGNITDENKIYVWFRVKKEDYFKLFPEMSIDKVVKKLDETFGTNQAVDLYKQHVEEIVQEALEKMFVPSPILMSPDLLDKYNKFKAEDEDKGITMEEAIKRFNGRKLK
jgi:hypothetical protein